MPGRRHVRDRRVWHVLGAATTLVLLVSTVSAAEQTAADPTTAAATAGTLVSQAPSRTALTGSSQVLVATCVGVGSDQASGKTRLALRVVDDRGATRLLGYAQVIQYGYVDIPTGCEDVPRRIDATGHWLVAEDNPARRAGAFEHEPDYRTLKLVTLYNLRAHTHRTIYRRTRMTFGDRQPRLIRPANVAVFTDHGQPHALTIPRARRTPVPTAPPRPARIGRCDFAHPGVDLADGRRVDLPADTECVGVLDWLGPDQLAVAAADPIHIDLQTLYICDPTTNTATPVAPAPGYDPRLHRDLINVSFSTGTVSGGKAYAWVRFIPHAGTARARVIEDVWAVGTRSAPARVLHFAGNGPGGSVASITPWPLTP
jgi:hypothetical protein